MSDNSSSGVGCGTVVLIVFVTLKLAGVIAWSWWWVLSPIWISLLLALIVALLAAVWWIIASLN